jgi:hypothetical protein
MQASMTACPSAIENLRLTNRLDWKNDDLDNEFPLPRLVGLPAVRDAPAHPMA